MSLDWTDEAWRERWAMLARQREAERRLEPAVFEQLRVEAPLLPCMTIQQAAAYLGYGVSDDGRSLVMPIEASCSAGIVYSQHAGGPDLPDDVPDPVAPDRDPG